MQRSLIMFFTLTVFMLPALCGAAEDYPSRPLRFFVPFPAGGGTDGLARILGGKLTEMWGQQVVIDNRTGAQGNIGTAMGAKAAPDGYTITLAHSAPVQRAGLRYLEGFCRCFKRRCDAVHSGGSSIAAGEDDPRSRPSGETKTRLVGFCIFIVRAVDCR